MINQVLQIPEPSEQLPIDFTNVCKMHEQLIPKMQSYSLNGMYCSLISCVG